MTFAYDPYLTPGVQAQLPRSSPLVLFTAQQLAAAGAKTDPQATTVVIPPGATSGTMFVTYAAGSGATGGVARGDIFVGAAPTGALAFCNDARPYYFNPAAGGVEQAFPLDDIPLATCAQISVQAWELGDVAHPGTISIRFVFR